MANLKSSKKDVRRIIRRTDRNRQIKSRLKSLRKTAEGNLASAAPEAKVKSLGSYFSALDKAVKSNTIHRNKVNRLKSRLTRRAAVGSKTAPGGPETSN